MPNLIHKQEGSVIIIVAISLAVLLGFAALGIDVGIMYTAKNQLQAAVDSAALAGASGLIVDQATASARAVQFAQLNRCIKQPVSPVTVTFPVTNRIRVDATRTLPLYFARILGHDIANISAHAIAEIKPLTGTRGMRPWAVPDSVPSKYTIGDLDTLKVGENGSPGTRPGFFYPVDFPPIFSPTTNITGDPVTGASMYENNIRYGAADPVYIGDILGVEMGNMVGPTSQGVKDVIALDPLATWVPTESGGYLQNSLYSGFTSPRIIKIPFYDESQTPKANGTITVTGLGAFFVVDVQGKDVTGIFIEIATAGSPGGFGNPGTPSSLMGVHLIE